MDALFTLLALQKEVSQAESLKKFEFLVVNETRKLFEYSQAVFFQARDGIRLSKASGNVEVDGEGAYAQWLKPFIKAHLHHEPSSVMQFCAAELEGDVRAGFEEFSSAHAVLVRFETEKEGLLGGLWIERDKPLNKAEIPLIEELAAFYASSYALFTLREKRSVTSFWGQMKKRQKWILLALLGVCLLPVRLSVTAPAEIIAQNPYAVTVPYDGVLDDVAVKPGDPVAHGDLLFSMDKTDLQGKIDNARQALETAKTKLSRLRRESLRVPEKKAELNALSSEIALKEIEYEYARTQLEKSDVRAVRSGLAIFSDADEFEGQPVRTGRKVMVLAEPSQAELLMRVPVDGMIPISKESGVEFFLNVSPLSGYEAQILSIGYQASPDPDGLLTYKVRAKIANSEDVRIGWKGSAKIQGEWSVLGYALLRRPLVAFRKITGI